ncbi:hypothetical protein GJR96_00885 [Haloferax sp. MBLA0076]|uniref:Twin-arginine translocation signal domain-containing protein n=1 Tax=Haloferax litoreum TaxID=2666140 RepID=A0A6A8GBU7_9EURY|nr:MULTISPECIES: hypothetical protein [Haloferax]KAB1192070.1 hypothetical protein Hfx1148_00890 [Haloferax sp. CBA1148]MRX20515.1 hypothetical protein [Haloferax litoreum]
MNSKNEKSLDSDGPRLSRRQILKATAASAASGAVLAGTAGATEPTRRINFCGCSQVCLNAGVVEYEDVVTIWLATEPFGPDDFETATRILTVGDRTCFEADHHQKIIAVKRETKPLPTNGSEDGPTVWWGNPSRCAKKALEAWDMNPSFENTKDGSLSYGTFDGTEVLRSNCGFGPSGGAHPGNKR